MNYLGLEASAFLAQHVFAKVEDINISPTGIYPIIPLFFFFSCKYDSMNCGTLGRTDFFREKFGDFYFSLWPWDNPPEKYVC